MSEIDLHTLEREGVTAGGVGNMYKYNDGKRKTNQASGEGA